MASWRFRTVSHVLPLVIPNSSDVPTNHSSASHKYSCAVHNSQYGSLTNLPPPPLEGRNLPTAYCAQTTPACLLSFITLCQLVTWSMWFIHVPIVWTLRRTWKQELPIRPTYPSCSFPFVKVRHVLQAGFSSSSSPLYNCCYYYSLVSRDLLALFVSVNSKLTRFIFYFTPRCFPLHYRLTSLFFHRLSVSFELFSLYFTCTIISLSASVSGAHGDCVTSLYPTGRSNRTLSASIYNEC